MTICAVAQAVRQISIATHTLGTAYRPSVRQSLNKRPLQRSDELQSGTEVVVRHKYLLSE